MAKHMHFHREIDELKKTILTMGTLVEDRLRRACAILHTRDRDQVQAIMAEDWEVDDMEIRVEEECLKILALHQPVARDLRLIVSIIKINNELERIADIAVNIAKRISTIMATATADFSLRHDYQPMAAKVMEMVKASLDALVTEDAALARTIFLMDDQVNGLRDAAYKTVIEEIGRRPDNAASLVNAYLIARHLERIGDRAINIAEEIIYLVEGEIVRSSEDPV
ncbi:phosphate signaling complex protein PhoU [Desulfobulbus sp.]|uniref:phosphate signaling complex protein PhoU n=1 Tax=Desulfobulbus sp. TaxID=895 RepID=UPI00286F071F|nr:phosphate signaling complex protein PhoU [Desulfobulbus sp.]